MMRSLGRGAHVSLVAIVVLVVAATIALVAATLPGASARPADGVDGLGRGQVAGIGVAPPGQPQDLTNADFPRLRADGLDTVSVDVWWDVDAATQSHVAPGSLTITDATLISTIRAAKARGLKVVMTPKVWCPHCRRAWSGVLRPANVDSFFREYRVMVDKYAEIAQQEGVWLYMLGREMNTLQAMTNDWRAVARDVRHRYHGLVSYDIDWSTFVGYAPLVQFWDAVDVVSVSAYFPLSDAARPSITDLRAAWDASQAAQFRGADWFDDLARLAATTRRPILFAEVGYLSSTHAAMRPYDPGSYVAADQRTQANAYRALLERFDGVSWWAGAIWWEWGIVAGAYTPRNKEAEHVLQQWYVPRG